MKKTFSMGRRLGLHACTGAGLAGLSKLIKRAGEVEVFNWTNESKHYLGALLTVPHLRGNNERNSLQPDPIWEPQLTKAE